MQILYISTVLKKETFDELLSIQKKQKNTYGMPVASNKFHNLIIDGLNNNSNNVTAITGRAISSDTHDKLFWSSYHEKQGNIDFKYLTIINVPIIKQLYVGVQYFFNTLNWLAKNKKLDKIIIYDASYVSSIPFVIFATKFFRCKKIGVFADIYSYMADTSTFNRKSRKLDKILKRMMRWCYNNTDKYIFLSEQMNALININKKPYFVMEGIADKNLSEFNSKPIKSSKYIVMYAGALKEEYGLKTLIDGFMEYENINVELDIYGDGNIIDYILEKSKIDKRIKYCGILNNDEIIKKEMKATLLINPRPTNSEFTKYSFPSKIIEYMTSGTPILTTRLPTIPKEYEKYLYFIEDNGKDALKKALTSILKKDKIELYNYGKKARKFILKNKNQDIQSENIIEGMGCKCEKL
ncbi:MAG: glycosyltransferase [Bacilli bacterium]